MHKNPNENNSNRLIPGLDKDWITVLQCILPILQLSNLEVTRAYQEFVRDHSCLRAKKQNQTDTLHSILPNFLQKW